MLSSALADRGLEPRKRRPHDDLHARVFGDMNQTPNSVANQPAAAGGGAVAKTLNFFRKAVTAGGRSIECPTEGPCWLSSRKAHGIVTADDILMTFSQILPEDCSPDSPLHVVTSLSSALLDIGRQVISSPTKPHTVSASPQPLLSSGHVIIIQIVEARGLRNCELVGKSSPYVTIQLIRSGSRYRSASTEGEEKDTESPLQQTRVVYHKLNPHFGETFRFSPLDLAGLQIEVKVWNWSRYFRHVLLGCKTINISGISSSRYEDFWIDLEGGNNIASSSVPNEPGEGGAGEAPAAVESFGRVHLVITLPKLTDTEP
jgi:hypothetical protein